MRLGLFLFAILCSGCLRGGFADRDRGGGGDLGDAVGGRDHRLDGRKADGRPAEAGAEAGPCRLGDGCEECQPLQNPSCTKACTDASECDDLPGGLDPWPAVCNPIVFSDGFIDSALSSWLVDHENGSPGAVSVPACGRLRFSMTAQQTRWIWLKPSVWPPPALKAGALAVVRFRVPAGRWQVQLFLEAAELSPWFAPQEFRLCELSGWPGVQEANLRNQVRTGAAPEALLDQRITVAPGEEVRLQSWITGAKAYCRVSATTELATTAVETGALAAGGLMLAAVNPVAGAPDLQVDVDWIRVFNHD